MKLFPFSPENYCLAREVVEKLSSSPVPIKKLVISSLSARLSSTPSLMRHYGFDFDEMNSSGTKLLEVPSSSAPLIALSSLFGSRKLGFHYVKPLSMAGTTQPIIESSKLETASSLHLQNR